jgi:hypothetical protein
MPPEFWPVIASGGWQTGLYLVALYASFLFFKEACGTVKEMLSSWNAAKAAQRMAEINAQAAIAADALKDREADRVAAKEATERLLALMQKVMDDSNTNRTASEIRHTETVGTALKTLGGQLQIYAEKNESLFAQNEEIASGQARILEALSKNTLALQDVSHNLLNIGVSLEQHMKLVQGLAGTRKEAA